MNVFQNDFAFKFITQAEANVWEQSNLLYVKTHKFIQIKLSSIRE